MNNNYTLMPLVSNRFQTFFSFDTTRGLFSKQIVSCEIPKITFDPVYGAKWENIEISFRNDIGNLTSKEITKLVDKQIADHNSTFDITINILDGVNNVIQSWSMTECKIISIAYSTMNYSSSDACLINAIIKYKNAEIKYLENNKFEK